MNTGKLSIFSFCLVMCWNTLFGQLNPNMLKHYDELKGTVIYDVLPDRKGNIWIATQSGLVKYDGYEYIRYHPDLNDSTTIGAILTYSLHEDIKGNIWIGCLDYVFKYDPATKLFSTYPLPFETGFPAHSQSTVAAISEDLEGKIYFGLISQLGFDGTSSLVYYDELLNKLFCFENPDSMPINNVLNITTDPHGNLWLRTWNGVHSLDRMKNLSKHTPDNESILKEKEWANSLQSDSSGLIWFTTIKSRLGNYDPKTNKIKLWQMNHLFEGEFTRSYIIDIEFDEEQNIWMTSNQGIIHFNRQTEEFSAFLEEGNDFVHNSSINALEFDGFGNLWIGSETAGLLKYNDKAALQSSIYNDRDNSTITSGWILKILEQNDGSIWIATRNGTIYSGLNKFDPSTGNISAYPYTSLTPKEIWSNVCGLKDENMLLFDYRGEYSYLDLATMQVRDALLDSILLKQKINSVVTDSEGTDWYCTTNGLYAWDGPDTDLQHFNLSGIQGGTVVSNEVTNVFESPVHGLWILTNNGFYLMDENRQINRHAYDPDKGDVLLSQDINAFYEDKNGIAWIGTWQGGLYRFDPVSQDLKTYTVNEGLPHMSIQGILGDEKNNALWLSTFAGISRFSIDDEQFNNFSLSDGIQGLLYADWALLKTSSNYFIFGGSNGITYFNPDDIDENSIPPIVSIMDFKVANQSIDLLQAELELSHDQNNISIIYNGIQYDNPSGNNFKYILENYNDSWREVGNLRSAFYYNLPHGKYTFRIKAANSNGVWNEKGASLSFTINPPWWMTWWAYIIYGFLGVGLIIAIDRIQRRRLIEKTNRQAREKELEQAREIEKAYNKLKTTQSQLLHAEKMASLGELTAGIAHEIQNPLNFINNFSEVNTELIEELNEEILEGNLDAAKDIANDIAGNEEKITSHGKRADAIVKNMLQHSRSRGEERQPTDINSLADEYLRLSYHGLRAKDKSFNADFKMIPDKNLPKIDVVPQDIGRVILNLINNAFHACAERSRSSIASKSKNAIDGYKPMVSVTTEQSGNQAIIRIKDNGNGISEDVLDKIFQPFFTTKSSGEGTGLGLSLSFDIITKGHGGELSVETKENEGSEFIIQLPING